MHYSSVCPTYSANKISPPLTIMDERENGRRRTRGEGRRYFGRETVESPCVHQTSSEKSNHSNKSTQKASKEKHTTHNNAIEKEKESENERAGAGGGAPSDGTLPALRLPSCFRSSRASFAFFGCSATAREWRESLGFGVL